MSINRWTLFCAEIGYQHYGQSLDCAIAIALTQIDWESDRACLTCASAFRSAWPMVAQSKTDSTIASNS